MRKLVYSVAASLDGFIAGPNGEYDWIPDDPDMDLATLFQRFDTLVTGSGTYRTFRSGGQESIPGMRMIVFSKSLSQNDCPGVELHSGDAADFTHALKQEDGKDIWLFGGGKLFKSLVAAGLVDEVEVAVAPVLLGEGIPLLPGPAERHRLKLTRHRTYGSGIVLLSYAISRESGG